MWRQDIVATEELIRENLTGINSANDLKSQLARTIKMIVLLSGLLLFFISLTLFISYRLLIQNLIIKDEQANIVKLNDQIEDTENLFRRIFTKMPFGVFVGKKDGKILAINPMFKNIVARSRIDIMKMNWRDIFHLDTNNYSRAYRKKKYKKSSFRRHYMDLNGDKIWVDLNTITISLGKEEFCLGLVKDITKNIVDEKALQESERSLSVFLANLPGMAFRCLYDRDWTMEFVSDGCYELTGYPPSSLLFNKEIKYNQIINEFYQENVWQDWSKALQERRVFKGEYPIITAEGETKWVYEQGSGVYDSEGNVVALEGLIIDISAQKKREEEIQYLNHYDVLTGLYNRRYFEIEKKRMDKEKYLPLSVIVGDIDGLKLVNNALGYEEGDIIIAETASILKCASRKYDIIARTGGDDFTILLPNTSEEEANEMVNRIKEGCKKYRETKQDSMGYPRMSLGYSTKTKIKEPLDNIIRRAEDSMYLQKLLQSESLYSSILSFMQTTLFAKSQETEEHAQRLVDLSKMLGEKLNLSAKELDELELLSVLHDIGKIGINDAILNKPGKLTQQEWIEVKTHSEIGYRIAMSSPELVSIAHYILTHHERWDGNGYPKGLKGEEIPLLSRIIAIVDSYDAMTHDRVYRTAMTKEEALEEIANNAGTQFDPALATLFVEEKRKLLKGKVTNLN